MVILGDLLLLTDCLSGHAEIKLSSPKFSCTYLKYSLTLADKMGLGQSGWKSVVWVSPWAEAQTWIQSTKQWKCYFHMPPVSAEATPRKVYQELCTASSTEEMMLSGNLEEVCSPFLSLKATSLQWLSPWRPSSKRRILITLRKEKNKVVNERCRWLQMLAGICCQSLCSESPQPHLILKEEKNLLVRYLKLIFFSFMWEDKLWYLRNYFILIVYFTRCLVFKDGLDLILESLSYCSVLFHLWIQFWIKQIMKL